MIRRTLLIFNISNRSKLFPIKIRKYDCKEAFQSLKFNALPDGCIFASKFKYCKLILNDRLINAYRINLLLILFFLIFSFFIQIKARNAQTHTTIEGYWELTAEFEDFDITSTVRFKTAADKRTITGIALGPTDGRDASFQGEISDDKLLLNTLGPNGKIHVKLTLNGDDLAGTWSAGGKEGKISGIRIKTGKADADYYAKYFKVFYESLKNNFYDPNYNGVDIEKLREKYASQIGAVADDTDFVQLMRRMAAEFKVSHIDFYLSPKSLPVKQKTPVVSWKKLSDKTGYLRLRSFEAITLRDEANYYQALEKALAELSLLPNLVIDLRGNSGGDLELLYKTLNYFIPDGERVGYAFTRTGADKIALLESNIAEAAAQFPAAETDQPIISQIYKNGGAAVIKIKGGATKSYRGKTALLIDENCYSACEIFSAAMQETANATVIGRRSGGGVLGSYTDSISQNMIFTKKDTGWRMQIPTIDFYTPSGKRLEGEGVIPNIEIKEKNTDKELQKALEHLQAKK